MPITPYIVSGTCIDEDASAVTSTRVVAHNTTNNERLDFVTNSLGQYLIDLANAPSGWSSGDSITVYIRQNGYWAESTFTISGENQEVNLSTNNQVTNANFREKGWYVFYKVLESGTFAITLTDIDGTSLTYGNHVSSEFNDKLVATNGYPVVVIYTPEMTRMGISLDKAQQDSDVNFLIEVYHVASRNVKQLTDDIENQIARAQEVWNGIGLGDLNIPSGGTPDIWDEGTKKIHRITMNINFQFDGRVSIP